jgi:hypothetical protein
MAVCGVDKTDSHFKLCCLLNRHKRKYKILRIKTCPAGPVDYLNFSKAIWVEIPDFSKVVAFRSGVDV